MNKNADVVAICLNCERKTPYRVEIRQQPIVIKGVEATYDEVAAFCAECGKEVYAPEVNDANVKERERLYQEMFGSELNKKGND